MRILRTKLLWWLWRFHIKKSSQITNFYVIHLLRTNCQILNSYELIFKNSGPEVLVLLNHHYEFIFCFFLRERSITSWMKIIIVNKIHMLWTKVHGQLVTNIMILIHFLYHLLAENWARLIFFVDLSSWGSVIFFDRYSCSRSLRFRL